MGVLALTTIESSDMAIEIRMKRPGEQYSIYKSHNLEAESSKGSVKSGAATAEPK